MFRLSFLTTFLILVGSISGVAQDSPESIRSDAAILLDKMKTLIKDKYYDKNFNGLDLDARFKVAKEKLKNLDYNWQTYRVLVQVLLDFDDSHTSFVLPPRADYFDYGFSLQMIGSDCLVTAIDRGSDAERKGLTVGSRVVEINKFKPNRRDLGKILYLIYKLDSAKAVDLKVVNEDGSEFSTTVVGKTQTRKEFLDELKKSESGRDSKPFFCNALRNDLVACKLLTFSVEKNVIDKMMQEVSAYPNFIFDLRGNGGGYLSTLEYLTGWFFEKDIKLGDTISRNKLVNQIARGKGTKAFKGRMAVLVDSNSASASEIFSRVMQLEKRAKVYGDVTKGAVMASILQPLNTNTDQFTSVAGGQYAMSITISDFVMSDGSRRERTGVAPDFPFTPNSVALSKGFDPILALAANTWGFEISPEAAGSLRFLVP